MSAATSNPSRNRQAFIALALLLLSMLCAGISPRAFLAAWLAAWWTFAGLVLGALANLWLHTLTGGDWIQPIRQPLQATVNAMPLLSLLLAPIALCAFFVYPWSNPEWVPSVSVPGFKQWWLSPGLVLIRLLLYVLLWNVFALVSASPGKEKAWAAAGLGMLALTLSSAGVDLIMSLQPDWYSSGFGLILICSAMKLGLAAAIVAGADFATPEQRRDLGNLLLMYVMLWGYVAFVQFQIIWAENLPREISWYVPRLQTAWKWTGVLLIVGGFFTPLLLLLSRRFKENGRCLRNLAGGLCFMAYVETAWLVMPSVPDAGPILLAAAPLALGGILLLAAGKLRHDAR